MKTNPPVDTSFWDRNRGTIRSRKGGWKIGEAVYCHGYNMLEEFIGHKSYFQVLILNATGRLVERRIADWFEAIFISMSWPDPRIWCNQIGALGGTMRTSIVAATTAGLLAADSRNYAQRTLAGGCQFISSALNAIKTGLSAEEFVLQQTAKTGISPNFMGYSRPVAKGDERVPAMERVSKDLKFPEGEHLTLAYEIEKVLLQRYDEAMNLTGYASAFLCDQGFTGEEICRIGTIIVNSGVTACYTDTIERPAGAFLPMRCEDIDYQGPPPRALPDRR